MAHEVSWYVENRVIRIRFYGDLLPEEFLGNNDSNLEAFIASGIDPMFLLIDLREVPRLPLNLGQLSHTHKSRGNSRVAWTIVVSNSSLFKFFGVVMSKVTSVPVRTFETLKDANDFIAHNAPDLLPVLKSHEGL